MEDGDLDFIEFDVNYLSCRYCGREIHKCVNIASSILAMIDATRVVKDLEIRDRYLSSINENYKVLKKILIKLRVVC